MSPSGRISGRNFSSVLAKKFSRYRQIFFAALLTFFAVAVCVADEEKAHEGTRAVGASLKLDRAEVCKPGRFLESPPGDQCNWKATSLPSQFVSTKSERDNGGLTDAWYRLRFDASRSNRQMAVYAVGLSETGQVFVNGHLIRTIGPMEGALPHNWNRSQYVVLPPDFVEEGINELEIQVRGYSANGGYLGTLYVGDADSLRQVWESRVFWQNEVVLFLSIAAGVIGLLMLGVWLGRREDTKYLWFGVAALCWVCVSVDFGLSYIPVSEPLWNRMLDFMPLVRTEAMYLFALRYAGKRQKVAERATWTLCGLATATICAGVMPPAILALIFLAALGGSLYILWLLVAEGMKHSLVEGISIAIAATTQTVLSALDLQSWTRSDDWGDKVFYAVYSEPLFLIVIFVILMRQFIESLNAYQKLAGVMEARVEEKRLELAENYNQLVEARRSEGIAKERARIMGEMHDGIGSQLTMALSMVSRAKGSTEEAGTAGNVAQVLRESIEDLQLIIDSLEPVENDLLTVLGTLRYRLQNRIASSGLSIDWRVGDLPPLPMLTPQAVLSILRIVQEAFANSIKHSGATEIKVSTKLSGEPGKDEIVSIVVMDNGSGFDGASLGRGMDNMRNRAIALNGKLQVKSDSNGTQVTISFPTERKAVA